MIEGVRSKVTDVAVDEVAVKAVVTWVIECFSPTSAKLLLSMRLVPVRVIALVLLPLTDADEWEMAVRAGELAVSR